MKSQQNRINFEYVQKSWDVDMFKTQDINTTQHIVSSK